MDYLETEDNKRAVLAAEATPPPRGAATDRPIGEVIPKSTEEWKAIAKHWFNLTVQAAVTLPLFIGIGVGLIVYHTTESGLPRQLAEGLFVGGLLSGGFAWSQAVASELSERRALRVQLGLGSDLRLADLADANLSHAYLRGRQLAGAKLSNTRLFQADFSAANLRDARLTESQAVGAHFSSADMTAAGGYKANFSQCHLDNATLQGASLCHAKFTQADLRGADLRNADLRGADLTGAELEGALLEGCWYSDSTRWPKGFEPSSGTRDEGTDNLGRIHKPESAIGEAPVIDLTRDPKQDGLGRTAVTTDP